MGGGGDGSCRNEDPDTLNFIKRRLINKTVSEFCVFCFHIRSDEICSGK